MSRSTYLKLAKLSFFTGLIFILVSYLPAVFYSARSQGGKIIANYLIETAQNAPTTTTNQAPVSDEPYQPAYSASLPFESRLIVPSIGIDTQIHEASYANFEEALKKGVWRAPHGTPTKREKPTILAAHRFGYLKWSNTHRRQNSFFNLPKLKSGDTVQIIWRQRTYTYAIYNIEENTEITDYSASLILYTCRDLTSNIRHFVYLKLLEI